MSDIFISYASEDKEKAGLLAKVLEQQGWSVWWDREIPAGRAFDEVIEEALDSAKCVFVLWSKASVKSDWVKEEASEGNRRKILVPALIEDVNIPLGFKRIQAIRLVDWKGQKTYPEFNKLILDIEKILGIPRKVHGETEGVDLQKDEALKREKKKGNTIEKNAGLQQYPKDKIETKPLTIESKVTEPNGKAPYKSKAEEEKKYKSNKLHDSSIPSTAKKKSKLSWLLPGAIVFVIGIIVLVVYLTKSPKSEIERNEQLVSRNQVKSVKNELEKKGRKTRKSQSLRSEPRILSNNEVFVIVREKSLNLPGQKIKGHFIHDYERKLINGDVVIIDYATGLNWQQSGSAKTMSWAETNIYIDNLNSSKFAGYTDWRVPTIEELVSLVEFEINDDGLYIDPLFDSTQRWCGSSDKSDDDYYFWGITLYEGKLYRHKPDFPYYYRAVRSD